jgi:hypothetical protein
VYFVRALRCLWVAYRDKKLSGVFVRFHCTHFEIVAVAILHEYTFNRVRVTLRSPLIFWFHGSKDSEYREVWGC